MEGCLGSEAVEDQQFHPFTELQRNHCRTEQVEEIVMSVIADFEVPNIFHGVEHRRKMWRLNEFYRTIGVSAHRLIE